MCTINDSHMVYGSWAMGCNGQNFLSFWTIFFPFTWKSKNLEKIKKHPYIGIIILHMCIINDNHIMYGSWDMEGDRQNFLSFWTVFLSCFLSFYNPTTQKLQYLENWKKCLEISSFYTSMPKIMIICYTVL